MEIGAIIGTVAFGVMALIAVLVAASSILSRDARSTSMSMSDTPAFSASM